MIHGLRQSTLGAFSKLRTSYVKDISWVLSGSVVSQAIVLLSLPVLTRVFSPDDFGLQNLVLQSIGFVTVVLTWRYEFFIPLPKIETEARAIFRFVIFSALATAILMSGLMWLFSDPLSAILGAEKLQPFMAGIPTAAGLMSISLAYQSLAQRRLNFRQSGMSEVAGKFGYVLIAVLGGWLLAGPWGLILAIPAGAVFKIAFLHWFSQAAADKHAIDLSCMRKVLDRYKRLAGSMSTSHFLMALTGLIPSVYIARTYGSELLGQYALVLTTLFLPSVLLGNSIGQVFYQRAAAAWARNEGFIDIWKPTAKWLALTGVPVYLIIGLLAAWIYPLVFGIEWKVAGEYAAIMVPAAFFSFVSSPLDRACLVVGSWKYVIAWHLLRTLSTCIVVFLAEVYHMSIDAFIICLSIQMSICYLVDLWAGHRFSQRKPPQAMVGALDV